MAEPSDRRSSNAGTTGGRGRSGSPSDRRGRSSSSSAGTRSSTGGRGSSGTGSTGKPSQGGGRGKGGSNAKTGQGGTRGKGGSNGKTGQGGGRGTGGSKGKPGQGGGRGKGGSNAKGGQSGGARGSGARRSGSGHDDRRAPEDGPKQWGSLARKGARRLDEDRRGAGTAAPSGRAPQSWEPEEWIDEGPLRDAAEGAVSRGGSRGRDSGPTSAAELDVGAADLSRAVGPKRAAKVEARLREAADAFDHERFGEARSILAPLVEEAPGSAALRELHGLTLYRLGRWKKAGEELEAFRQISGSTEQNPVLADCYRAQKRYAQVDELWEELRQASPGAPLVTEGRIVAAGALADQGRLDDAIRLLEKGFSVPKRPKEHHLRRAYALADLKERAGDVPAARSLFGRIAAADPDFADVRARARALS